MNHDFDVFVKEHLQEILCQAEKEHSLALIRKAQVVTRQQPVMKPHHHHATTEVHLQDCAISPSFSHNHL